MASKEPKKNTRAQSPGSTPESREQQLVRLAVDLAEKQLSEGTASPSVINHYLKIGSTREAIERDILEKQARFLEAKASSMTKNSESEDLAKEAIEAMKHYNSSSN
jgi:hypothetical protein